MKLRDRVAIITGGAQGLGMAMAELFAAEGARIVAADIADLNYQNPSVEGYRLDITDSKACRECYEYVIQKYGKIDILINNAGITSDAMTGKMTDEVWQRVLDINLNGSFYLTRHVGPHMQANKSGAIINLSSVSGMDGNIGQANYAATKAGVIGMTKSWAKEFARKGGNVRVNAIAPGFILTEILSSIPKEMKEKYAVMSMLGRPGQPEEVAKAALFLASDDASYITGQVLRVDGGTRL